MFYFSITIFFPFIFQDTESDRYHSFFLKQRIGIVIFYCCLPLIKFLVPEIKATIMQNLDVYTEFTKFTTQKDKILIYLSYIFFNFRLILDRKICSQ